MIGVMTPASEAVVPQQHPQQQGGTATAVAPPSSGKLSFDEVSKHFSLPIAEAASILGVCTSVLKRICRNNGIVRWPYRKFLAGKTVEEIKRDAAREKTKELAQLSKIAKPSIDVQKMMLSTSVGLASTFGIHVLNRTPGLAQETSKLQRGVSMSGNVLHSQDNKFLQYKWPSVVQPYQARNIPTYMDEFKYGFPGKGLSSASVKWWGSSNNEVTGRALLGEPTTEEEVKKESCLPNETSRCTVIEDQPDSNLEKIARISEPSARICSLRKKAVQCGRKSLKVGISKGCGTHKLSKGQRLMLLQVFKSSFPDQWKGMFS